MCSSHQPENGADSDDFPVYTGADMTNEPVEIIGYADPGGDVSRNWAARVAALEEEGMTTSDAQSVADAEDMLADRVRR